jgi:hypothetical protein
MLYLKIEIKGRRSVALLIRILDIEEHPHRPPIGCVCLDIQEGIKRDDHIFYSIWMKVTWGQGERRNNFWWRHDQKNQGDRVTPPHPTLTSNQTHT